jgi:serine/threonine-protein kinase
MGTVYVALDERLGRKVAVKLLKEELSDDPRFIERFRREARSAAALSHPNIASVYDYGSDGDVHFIVMELVDGEDLGRVLRKEGPLETERAASIAAHTAAALGHAHAAGVVHRDIKPANVLLGSDDRVKVTDFGIARAAGDSTLTATGVMLGTAHYISPEQASGSEVGPPSDIYSLGIVLFESLTGSVPFTGDSAVAVAMRHISDPVPPPSSINPDIDSDLDEIVARATAKDPSERFRSAAEMGGALVSLITPTEENRGLQAAGPGSTAVMTRPDQDSAGSVWPIPGSRYDPAKLGRAVIITFVALAVIAAGLLVWRISTKDDAGRKKTGASKPAAAAAADPTPSDEASSESPPLDSFPLPEDILGLKYKDVVKGLESRGFIVEVVPYYSQEYEKDTVIGTEPDVGSMVSPGDTITLVVSTDKEEHGHGHDKEHGEGD